MKQVETVFKDRVKALEMQIDHLKYELNKVTRSYVKFR